MAATHVVDTVIVLYARVWAAVAVWRCRPDFTGARQRGGADQQSDPPLAAAARRILSVRQTAESPGLRQRRYRTSPLKVQNEPGDVKDKTL